VTASNLVTVMEYLVKPARCSFLILLLLVANTATAQTILTGKGKVTVRVDANEGSSPIIAITLMIDNKVVATAAASPLIYMWNLAPVKPGQHVVSASAVDSASEQGSSYIVVIKQ
jgi:hypothetical protein